MGKAIITITDEEESGSVSTSISFEPELDMKTDKSLWDISPAQSVAISVMEYLAERNTNK